MKDKNLAAVLAFFFGIFGVHRFYLGQTGLGILYCMFFWLFGITAIIGLIDAIVLLAMDREEFDYKYNRRVQDRYRNRNNATDYRSRDTDFDRRDPRWDRERQREERYQRREARRQAPPPQPKKKYTAPSTSISRNNPFKKSGIEKFKDYDYDGAIEDFQKALSVSPRDIAVHFNLACAYSLTEEKEQAFVHLSKAVQYGFVDFKKIQEHDALAYLRIQDEFDIFKENNYRLNTEADDAAPPPLPEPPEVKNKEDLVNNFDLLEQIKKLGELREKGLLTNEEFEIQKRRLLD